MDASVSRPARKRRPQMTAVDTLLTAAVDPAAWDLHPDGDRFIVPVPLDAATSDGREDPPEPERFVVAVNWFEELNAKTADLGE